MVEKLCFKDPAFLEIEVVAVAANRFIPESVETFTFDCTSIPIFATVCIAHVFTHGLFRHRLRLLQTWSACFVKSEVFNRFRYERQLIFCDNLANFIRDLILS